MTIENSVLKRKMKVEKNEGKTFYVKQLHIAKNSIFSDHKNLVFILI